jgi:uncharacterized protein (TIGR02246 family)
MSRSFALLASIALLGCASQARDDRAGTTATFEQMLKEFSASLSAGDADRWLALWAEDGVQLPPDEPPVEGKTAIAAKMRGLLNRFKFDMTIQNMETHSTGDWGFVRGRYQATLTPKQGGVAIPIDGKYLTVLNRQSDGSWKIYRDIFNSNIRPGKSP